MEKTVKESVTGFTPGPWWYGGKSGAWYRVEAPSERWAADHVCNAFKSADAHLIAAAPTMYAELKALEWAGSRMVVLGDWLERIGESRSCPSCRGLEVDGHKPGCTLRAALATATPSPEKD